MMLSFPKKNINIAIAQTTSKDGDIEGNVKQAISLINEAGKNKVDLIVFPEKYLTGYVPDIIEKDTNKYTIIPNDQRLANLRAICKLNKICAVIGTPMKRDNKLYISSVIIDRNGVEVSYYDKSQLFKSEKKLFTTNNKQTIIEVNEWRIGMAICYDAGFAEHSRFLAQNGSHIYLNSSLFSKGMGNQELDIWLPARSLDNTIYSIVANHVGKTGIWDTCGQSGVWSPLGTKILKGETDKAGLLSIKLSPDVLEEARKKESMLLDSPMFTNSDSTLEVIKID
ncbi:carbon-nitrogen hydrolase family protein [Enterococcus plantarum]|uniref:carbon-nitrogen hydrolase family protein n=1 Tax=Enterococcus plantarum TaxID=1077675 RepID=UPI001A90A3AF|nr:carbon-nitrogen hydrolase family protein [Enterococcus plantarum]MBO0468541.1 carbon-nitrogen hydrolase family protein [Enterococcus plantarum]